MITVACVWVKGHVPYTAEYVIRLRNMVSRAAPEHGFVCLTDQPDDLPGVETIKIPSPNGRYAWWSKIELWNPKHGALQSGRVLYLDLDSLVVGNLAPIVAYGAGLCIIPDAAPNFVGKGALRTVKRFNSSVMCWEGGDHAKLFADWKPDVAKRLWGDQDWIGEQIPEATKMPLRWFPRLSQIVAMNATLGHALVVLCKKPKNEEAAVRWPWVAEVWR